MGTKMAVPFANIFMARIEKQILSQSCIKPLFWKRYIDDVFSLWKTSLDKIESFVEKANIFHSTIVEEPYWGLAGSSNKQQDRRVLVQ